MSEDRPSYTQTDTVDIAAAGSEIARTLAADLEADYGPSQRSAAVDLARLLRDRLRQTHSIYQGIEAELLAERERADRAEARLAVLEGRVRAVVEELRDLWTVHEQARLKAAEDDDPAAFNAAYFKENAYGYAARLLETAMGECGGGEGDASAGDGGGQTEEDRER